MDFVDEDEDEDEELEEDNENVKNLADFFDNEVDVETDSGESGSKKKTKKSNKMPDEEPHRKPLHPWLKTKSSEPTQKKARLDLSAFMETNSIQHEHKLVNTIHFFSISVNNYGLG